MGEDDFDVSIFLTELSTPHGILLRQKDFVGQKARRVGRVGGKMTGLTMGTREEPVVVLAAGEEEQAEPVVREESPASSSAAGGLEAIPPAEEDTRSGASKEGLFVSDAEGEAEAEDEEDGENAHQARKPPGRDSSPADKKPADDEKKKLALRTTYAGFRIYGRILCLVVKRKGSARERQLVGGAGQAMMEEWISASQMGEGGMGDE